MTYGQCIIFHVFLHGRCIIASDIKKIWEREKRNQKQKPFPTDKQTGKKIAHNINANAKKLSENSKNGIKEEEKKNQEI